RADSLSAKLELVRIGGLLQRFIIGDEFLSVKAVNRLIEGLHTILRRSRGNRLSDHSRFVLIRDAVANEFGRHQYLNRRHAAQPIGFANEAHRDDGFQHTGQLQSNLLLLMRWEYGDDAVDRFGCIERMERAEYQVTGFSSYKCRMNRLQIAHFTDEN